MKKHLNVWNLVYDVIIVLDGVCFVFTEDSSTNDTGDNVYSNDTVVKRMKTHKESMYSNSAVYSSSNTRPESVYTNDTVSAPSTTRAASVYSNDTEYSSSNTLADNVYNNDAECVSNWTSSNGNKMYNSDAVLPSECNLLLRKCFVKCE